MVPIHLHIGANNLVGDGGHRLVPVLLLRAVEQTLHDDWICFHHVALHNFLDRLGVKQKQSPLGGLVMHTLACAEKPFQELGSELVELLLGPVPHKVEHLFDLLDENHFFGWAGDRPELKKALDERDVELSRLFEIVLDAELKLRVVGR